MGLDIAKLSSSQPVNPQLGAEIALISIKFWATHPPIIVVLRSNRGTGNLVSIV